LLSILRIYWVLSLGYVHCVMELCVSATELVSRWGTDGRTKR
jgi:hypothetical protein